MVSKNEQGKKGIKDSVLIAIIGALATITAAFLSYRSGVRSTEIPIQATQTAEAKRPAVIEIVVTRDVEVTRQVAVAEIVTPTFTPTVTPWPHPIDLMDKLSNWKADACNEDCGREHRTPASSVFASVASGYTNNAIEVLYDIPQGGWILIKKAIYPRDLSNTQGIRFFYKGVGAPNTLEFKMVLRYPGDNSDTTFGKAWKNATDTGNNWTVFEALYGKDITCWWPAEQCEKHGNTLDLTAVYKIELGISHQSGDTPGLGRGTFDELLGIPTETE